MIAFLKGPRHQRDDEALSAVLEEWQQENERLLHTLADLQHDVMDRVSHIQARVDRLEETFKAQMTPSDKTTPPLRPNGSSRRRNTLSVHKRYADIVAMAEAGRSVADIAKETGRGNGEVQLILQLAARGNAHE